MSELLKHPYNEKVTVQGDPLKVGQPIYATDLYNSTSEKWLPVPPPLVGKPYSVDMISDNVVVVRPDA